MNSHPVNLGAPDSTVISGSFVPCSVTLVQQSVEKSGSDMLLLVDVRIDGLLRQFVVGGYWSTDGFRLTSMLEVTRVTPRDNTHHHGGKTELRGLGFTNPSAVLKDRVQQHVNAQDVGRPKEPSEAFSRRGFVGDWDEKPPAPPTRA